MPSKHLQIFAINRAHSTGVAFPCLFEDTGHDHLVNLGRFLVHHDINFRTVAHQLFAHAHAEHGEHQSVVPLRQRKRVLAVDVCRRTHRRAFQDDSHARQGLTALVRYHAGDFPLLRHLLLRTDNYHIIHNPERIAIPQYLAQGFFQGYVFTSHSNFTTGFNLLVAVKEIQVCLFLNRLDGFLPRGIHQIKANTVRLGVCARTHPQHSQEEQKEC